MTNMPLGLYRTEYLAFSVSVVNSTLVHSTAGLLDVIRYAIEGTFLPLTEDDVESGYIHTPTRVAGMVEEMEMNDYFAACPIPRFCTCQPTQYMVADVEIQQLSATYKRSPENVVMNSNEIQRLFTGHPVVPCDNCRAVANWSDIATSHFIAVAEEMLAGPIPGMMLRMLPASFSVYDGDKVVVDYLGADMFRAYAVYKERGTYEQYVPLL